MPQDVKGRMRDIFEEIFAKDPLDAMEAARRSMRPVLRRRFYDRATVESGPSGFAVLLDGKPVRTPARRPLTAPASGLAEALAAEWNAQKEVVDPAAMPLTRLANSIIDGVAQTPLPVAEEIAQYLRSDLLFYRAEGPRGLVERQERQWDPVLAWARDVLGARFALATGVMFVEQPAASCCRGDGRYSRGCMAAGRGVFHHDADRLRAAGARDAARKDVGGGSLGSGACGRRLEYGILGPRRARAGAAGLSFCGNACSGGSAASGAGWLMPISK